MTEYLILFAALAVVAGLLLLKGCMDERKRMQNMLQVLRDSFGKSADREYREGELDSLTRYFEKHQKEESLDDITWNDLNMDEIFREMNYTSSSAGQEYLYYMLRTPGEKGRDFEKMEKEIRYLTEKKEVREKLQFYFLQAGRTNRYSIYDYLDFLDRLGERSSRKQIIADLLFIPVIIMMAVEALPGFLLLIMLCCYNITCYMKDKREIEPFLVSFHYVFRMITLSEKLCREKIEIYQEEREELGSLLKSFSALKKSASWGMRTTGNSGNPLEIFADYINMIFHFDIIGFNRMLKEVRVHQNDIDRMLTITGKMESRIAIASYRKYLKEWCVPEKGEELEITDLYHPLLQDAVKNSIHVKRGVLITGSNASGKSTFLKAVAINAVLAQTIHTCAASSYRGVPYRIYTSMALKDNLQGGESYYIVEIKSLKRILDAASKEGDRVLCFVDEVLRGTNTVERIAASTQILKSLAGKNVCCFAATHDIELASLLQREYDNYHFEEEMRDGEIYFPYQLLKGRATTRNAIRLLSLMGYQDEIIDKAGKMAENFLKDGVWKMTE